MTLWIGTDARLYQAERDGTAWRVEPAGLDGLGGVRSLVFDSDDPSRCYAATYAGGVRLSTDGGRSWRDANRGIVYKEGWYVAQHPTSGDLFYGSGPAFVSVSRDRGESWALCEAIGRLPQTREWEYPRPPHVGHVRQIGLDPANPDLVLAAVEQGWMLRSEDRGGTWANAVGGIVKDCHSATFLPGGDVLGTTGQGVFRSSDGGVTWQPSRTGLEHEYMTQVAVHADRPELVFTAAAETHPGMWFRRPEGARTAFYRSRDAGRSWERLGNGLPELMRAAPRWVAGDPRAPGHWLVGMIDGSVWESLDAGETWSLGIEGLEGWVRYMVFTA